MTRTVVTTAPGDTVAEVARRLSEAGISAVPVCDDDGRLLGVVSEGGLPRPFGQMHALQRDWWLALLAEGTDLAPEFLDYIWEDHYTAADLMTAPVRTMTEDMPLGEAAGTMTRHGIKRLPVLRGGKLVGIVSRADLVRALLGDAQPPGRVQAKAEGVEVGH